MKILKRFFNIFKNRNSTLIKKQDNSKLVQSFNINSLQDKGENFEKMFVDYDSFKITISNINYSINVLFTRDLDSIKKEKIFKFVKEEFYKNITPPILGLNIRLIYDLSAGYKSIPEEKILKIFIGNTEL